MHSGSVFFSHTKNIEKVLVGDSLDRYERLTEIMKEGEICALAKGKCEILELDIGEYRQELRAILRDLVNARVRALRKNPLLGQLSTECLVALAFSVGVKEMRFGEFVVKQKQIQSECYVVLSGTCDVAYANVLDSLSLTDFAKYSSSKVSSRHSSVAHLDSSRGRGHLSPAISRPLTPIRFQAKGEETPKQGEDQWKERLRYSFWDNSKIGSLSEGEGTGYACFITDWGVADHNHLLQFIPLFPKVSTLYSLVGALLT